MRRVVSVCVVFAFLGCNRNHSDEVAPPVVPNEIPPKVGDNAGAWPVRHEYPGFGSQLWEYCVPYQPDIQKVLDELREREFKAARFYRGELRPKSFDDAFRNAGAAGT